MNNSRIYFWFFFPVSFLLLSSFYIPSTLSSNKINRYNDTVFCEMESAYSVLNNNIVQNELYTWTSKEQIDILRNSKNVLIKSRSEKYGKANYELVLEAKKAKGDSTAAFLLSDRFAKKRFAWPHPWATVRGYPGENYGDQLLRITFKDDAIFGSFINDDEVGSRFHFYTMNGKEVSVDIVKQHPEKLAVIYFVDSKKTTKKTPEFRGTYRSRSYVIKTVTSTFPYREYVICNEAMIKEWSYGTKTIIDKLKNDLAYLKMLQESLKTTSVNKAGAAAQRASNNYLTAYTADYWQKGTEQLCNYTYTVALVNKYYDLNEKQLSITVKTIEDAIRAQGTAFAVTNN